MNERQQNLVLLSTQDLEIVLRELSSPEKSQFLKETPISSNYIIENSLIPCRAGKVINLYSMHHKSSTSFKGHIALQGLTSRLVR